MAPLPCSVERLREGCAVAIVADQRAHTPETLAPLRQRKVFPAVYLMAFDDATRLRIYRAAKPDADGLNRVSSGKFRTRRPDLLENPLRPVRNHNVAPNDFHGRRTIAATDAQLQFGSANFDSEYHLLALPHDSYYRNDARLSSG